MSAYPPAGAPTQRASWARRMRAPRQPGTRTPEPREPRPRPRACAATSVKAKSVPRRRLWLSSPASFLRFAAARFVAFVELVALRFLARFGSIVRGDKRLQRGEDGRGHGYRIDLLARVEKARRLAIAHGDDERPRARLGIVFGLGHAP